MKYIDKALLRKWVETGCGFSLIRCCYIYFFQVTVWLLSITLGFSRVTIRDMGVWHKCKCMQFHNVFLSLSF